MDKVISVKGVSFKVRLAKDKKGRKGYFVAEKDLPATAIVKEAKPATVKKPSAGVIRLEVVELLNEMNEFKAGKLKIRSFDEYIQSV